MQCNESKNRSDHKPTLCNRAVSWLQGGLHRHSSPHSSLPSIVQLLLARGAVRVALQPCAVQSQPCSYASYKFLCLLSTTTKNQSELCPISERRKCENVHEKNKLKVSPVYLDSRQFTWNFSKFRLEDLFENSGMKMENMGSESSKKLKCCRENLYRQNSSKPEQKSMRRIQT